MGLIGLKLDYIECSDQVVWSKCLGVLHGGQLRTNVSFQLGSATKSKLRK